jgi:hypothetical protein
MPQETEDDMSETLRSITGGNLRRTACGIGGNHA